jgi:prepilin-type N-terminal cleavage/methylation domain-containing protein
MRRSAFTLVESAIALSIIGIAAMMALRSVTSMLNALNARGEQDALDINVQVAMERVKRHLRLSALDRMVYYPAGPGPYTAVSFPVARDDDGDGAIETDSSGRIIWDRTLVYHVWSGQPNELRLTVFDPRDNTMTDAERQVQLNQVVADGNGLLTRNGAHARTSVVFRNLFRWRIMPRCAVYDGYAPEAGRARNVLLGSAVLGTGPHVFTFNVIGKHAQSAGYKIGIDTLLVSPSYSPREAEDAIGTLTWTGPEPTREFMPGGSWSGNYQLAFAAQQPDQRMEIELPNDLWKETNFDTDGDSHQNTTVTFDSSFTPADFVVSLAGLGTNWSAAAQTGNPAGAPTDPGQWRGCAVRTLIRGEEMAGGNWIAESGGRCKVAFRAGETHSVDILAACIAEAASSTAGGMDAAPATSRPLLFGGMTRATIPAHTGLWSDFTDFPIDRSRSYLVSFLVDPTPGGGAVWQWQDLINPGLATSFVIPAASLPTATNLAAAAWSGRSDVLPCSAVIGVEHIYTTLPATGTYVSAIFDTHDSAPAYSEITSDAYVPSGTDIRLKIRTGAQSDLSDALAWTNIAAVPIYGVINPGDQRYIQFLTELRSDPTMLITPKLKEFTIKWHGPERAVDIGGDFTRGPEYGVFEVMADGREIVTGLSVDIEIYKGTRSFSDSKTLRSGLTVEINPRNTAL